MSTDREPDPWIGQPTRDEPDDWFIHRDDWEGTRVAGPMSELDAQERAAHSTEGYYAQRGEQDLDDEERER